MALDLARLAEQQLITTTSAIQLVTNPTGKKTVIIAVKAQNVTVNQFVTVSLYRVPDNNGNIGNLSETSHLLPYPIEITPMAGNLWEDKLVLSDANDSFWIKCSVANAIAVSVDGLRG